MWDEEESSPQKSSFGGASSGSGCRKCGEDGHFARECPQGGGERKKGCFNCGDEGHMSRDCDKEKKPRGCFNCGDEGHMSKDCDKEQKPRGCFNCGEEGHNKADCTAEPKEELGPDGKPRPPIYNPVHIEDDKLFDDGLSSGINFSKYENIPVSVSGEGEIPNRLEEFKDAGLREILLKNVQRAGYTVPTPIQRHCIPTIMCGRDIMGCAQTGSGKTAAFLLPILHKLLEDQNEGEISEGAIQPGAVIMAPTRELAIQIHNEGRKFALGSILRVVVCYGGTSVWTQLKEMQRGCGVLVATPGRLLDLVNRGKVAFSNLQFFVLDEADRMLDMGFLGDIEKIMNHASMPGVTERQTLCFSATFPEEIQNLAGKFLNNYIFYVVGMVGAANTDVQQEILMVDATKKKNFTVDKLLEIGGDPANKILVFVEKKRTADFLASYLCTKKINSTSIHGDRFQAQREEALGEFKRGTRNVLVATAVAARGLDIKGVTHVLNYDLPKDIDEYVHRIGRTGRVGNRGYALSFYDEGADAHIAKDLVKILEDAKQEVPDWLKTAASSSGYSGNWAGNSDFASTDVRGQGSAAFGGPSPPEDDCWD